MDVSLLDKACKQVINNQLELFKNELEIELFLIDRSYVLNFLSRMEEEISQKILGRFYSDQLSKPQKDYLYHSVKKTKQTARKKAIALVWEWWEEKMNNTGYVTI